MVGERSRSRRIGDIMRRWTRGRSLQVKGVGGMIFGAGRGRGVLKGSLKLEKK